MWDSHPDIPTLLAWVDRELDEVVETRVRVHLDDCDACSRRVAEMGHRDRVFGELLRELDGPAPDLPVEALIGPRPWPRPRTRWVMAASVAALLVCGGAAMAIPAVRASVARLIGIGEEIDRPAPTPLSGIEVDASEVSEILLPADPELGVLRVYLTDEDVVRLEATAATVRFQVRDRHILVTQVPEGSDLDLSLPGGMPELVIRVGDRVVARKSETGFEPAPAATGDLVIPLSRQ